MILYSWVFFMKSFDKEVKEKWQNTKAYKEYQEKTINYSKEKWNNVNDVMNNIIEEFSICMNNGFKSNSDEVIELVKKLQNHITNNYYTCTNDILLELGNMYVCDERFKANINKYAEGTASYIYEAIRCFCEQ